MMDKCEHDDCFTCPYPDCRASAQQIAQMKRGDKMNDAPKAVIKKSVKPISEDKKAQQKHDYYMKNKDKYREWNRKHREKKKKEKQQMEMAQLPEVGKATSIGEELGLLPKEVYKVTPDEQKQLNSMIAEVQEQIKPFQNFCNSTCIHYCVCMYKEKASEFKQIVNKEEYKFVDVDNISCKFRISQV